MWKIVIAVLVGVLFGMLIMLVIGLLHPYRSEPVIDHAADHVRLIHVWMSDRATLSLWKQQNCSE